MSLEKATCLFFLLLVATTCQSSELDDDIIVTNGKALYNILLNATLPLSQSDREFCTNVIYDLDYDANLPYQVYEYAVSELQFGSADRLKLATIIRSLDEQNKQSSELVLRVELLIYGNFVASKSTDNAYLLYIAYYMRDAKANQLLQDRLPELNDAIKSLPSSVQSLFFTVNSCFLNTERNEYLNQYIGPAVDNRRRNILVWRGPYDVDRFTIFAWTVDSNPPNAVWLMELNENKFRFVQGNSYYLCAADLYVKGLQITNQNVPANCEWRIDDCPASA